MAQRPEFNSRQKFVVFRDLKFAGRLFLEGQEFPWRSIGCSVRRLSQMYKARKLNMLEAQAPVTEEALLAMEPVVRPIEEAVVLVQKIEENLTSVDEKMADVKKDGSEEVAPKAEKPKLTDEEKKAKKAARRKAARKAAKEAKGE